MSKKKIKVRVKKRRIKVKRIIICILIILLFIALFYYINKLPIKNIYIVNNKLLTDKEIIEIAGIDDYPPYLSIGERNLKLKFKDNAYIKNVEVEKKLFNKIYIYVTEKRVLCTQDNKILFEDGTIIQDTHNISNYPILLSDISSIKDRFVTMFSLVEDNVMLKISEIEYVPNEVDNERFILNMNDGNLVYITLNKIEKINKYNSIYSKLDGKKGIIYLDSGDYVEIKEE